MLGGRRFAIRNRSNFLSGLLFLAIGLGTVAISRGYEMGTITRMGPGYFPLLLGSLLSVIGAVVAITALRYDEPEEEPTHWNFWVLGQVLFAVALFGFIIEAAGLVVSLLLLALISSYVSHEFTWRVALINAVLLTVFSLIVFIVGLKLPIPVWPPVLGYK